MGLISLILTGAIVAVVAWFQVSRSDRPADDARTLAPSAR